MYLNGCPVYTEFSFLNIVFASNCLVPGKGKWSQSKWRSRTENTQIDLITKKSHNITENNKILFYFSFLRNHHFLDIIKRLFTYNIRYPFWSQFEALWDRYPCVTTSTVKIQYFHNHGRFPSAPSSQCPSPAPSSQNRGSFCVCRLNLNFESAL